MGQGLQESPIRDPLWSFDILRYMPKIGPFKALAFNNPTPQTEDMYFKSINTTVDQYRIYLKQVGAGSLELANSDFDTGKETKAAEYSLTDETYAKLLGQLAARKFDLTSPDLRDNILNFYSDLSLPLEPKKDNAQWQSVLASLDQLKSATPNVECCTCDVLADTKIGPPAQGDFLRTPKISECACGLVVTILGLGFSSYSHTRTSGLPGPL